MRRSKNILTEKKMELVNLLMADCQSTGDIQMKLKCLFAGTIEQKQSGRIEKRTAFATCDIEWLNEKPQWEGLASIGGINTQFTTKKETTNEWHYYISSRELTAEELLKHARLEWSVENIV